MKIRGFTLIELIVVITILTILGTLAFISFKGYTTDAKDAKVFSDISMLHTGLSTYNVRKGTFPLPDNYTEVSSGVGNVITYQGDVGDSVKSIIHAGRDMKSPYDENYNFNINGKKNNFVVYGYTVNGEGEPLELIRSIKANKLKYEKGGSLLNLFDSSGKLITGDITNLPSTDYKAVLGTDELVVEDDGGSNVVSGVPDEIKNNESYYPSKGGDSSTSPSSPTVSVVDFFQVLADRQAAGNYVEMNTNQLKSVRVVNNTIVFTALPNTLGKGNLGFSDGTESGTIVSDGSKYPESVIEIEKDAIITGPGGEELLFFTGGDISNPSVTDGTYDGSIVLDNDITRLFELTDYVEYNGKIIFAGNDSLVGDELFITDGTVAGTKLLKDIKVGTNSSYSENLLAVNGKVYFHAKYSDYGSEIWETDGTTAGTKVIDIIPGSGSSMGSSTKLGYCNSKLYARGDTAIYAINVSDNSHTSIKAPSGGSFSASQFTCFKDKMYFSGFDPITGRELYITDGTQVGTTLVHEFNPGTGHGSPWGFHVIGNSMYFIDFNKKLWMMDGSTFALSPVNYSGLQLILSDLNDNMVADSSSLYFPTAGGTFKVTNGVAEEFVSGSSLPYIIDGNVYAIGDKGTVTVNSSTQEAYRKMYYYDNGVVKNWTITFTLPPH